MKTRVLLVENNGDFVGGGQVSFFSLVGRLDRSRFEPMVVCPNEGDFVKAAQERRIPAFVLPMPSLRRGRWLSIPLVLIYWFKLLSRHRIDIIHTNGTRAMIYAGLAGKIFSRPVLWHVRVLGSDGVLDRILARLAARVLVNSDAVARRFASISRHTSPSPIVIPNGVDLDVFRLTPADSSLSKRWRLEGKQVIVMLAQLIPWKRQEIAIQTLSLLRQRGLNVALLLVGDEVPSSVGYRSRLENLASELGVTEDCVFTGFRREVPAVLRLADLLIHPAADEPFGRALIEAMASRLPVVAAAGGGVEEVVEDNVTGRIVRTDSPEVWASTVEELLRNPSARDRMGRAGRRRAEESFSIDAHVRRVEEIYQEVLSSWR